MKSLLLLSITISGLHAAALSPQDEAASFELSDPALMIELVASEPEVSSPVSICWDTAGHLFVAEMIDYPVGPEPGRIRRLVDADGDGRYENSTIFADNIPFPNGVLPWRDGVLVTSAPNILFLRDPDGDGRADERRVILTGFAEGNQQLRVNGLFWGLDGWVYGANGRSDGELLRPGETNRISLRGHDFRFKPDTGQFEAIAGRSQFGNTRDDWGNRFLSWNTVAIRHEVIPERFLARNPNIPLTEAVRDLAPVGDTGEVYPRSPAPQTFNNESTSHFNALAGLTIYRGNALPTEYYGNAFVGETLRNLVHRRVLAADGPSFVARRVEMNREFLASRDPWFHPVNFATGPDGALYIVDFYRQWVEHPGFVPANVREKVAWRTGAEHGRIWRVRPGNGKRRELPLARLLHDSPMLFLGDPNAWWRDTAVRLIYEMPAKADLVGLQNRVPRQRGVNIWEQVNSLYLLAQLGKLDQDTVQAALRHNHPRVRETVARLAADRPTLLPLVAPLAEDGDPAVRLAATLSLGGAERDVRMKYLARVASRPDLDHTLAVAIRSGIYDAPGGLLEALPQNSTNVALLELARSLASDVATHGDDEVLQRTIGDLLRSEHVSDEQLAVFSGLVRALPRSQPARARWVSAPSTAGPFLAAAEKSLSSETTPPVVAEHALDTLAALAHFEASPSLLRFLAPSAPQPLSLLAIHSIGMVAAPSLYSSALAAWKTYTLPTRRELSAVALRSSELTAVLVEALQSNVISALELDAHVRKGLVQNFRGDKALLQKLLNTPSSADRTAILRNYTSVTQALGDRQRGRIVFDKNCVQCHAVEGSGGKVGPSLSGIASRGREALLVDILDPSRQVNPEFLSYSIELLTGDILTGLIVAEVPAAVTLRRPNVPDETIVRSQIRSVQASQLSLMPEGFESSITLQEMADLMEYLGAGVIDRLQK